MTSRTEQKPKSDSISTEGQVGESRRVIRGIDNPLTDLSGTPNQIILTPDGTRLVISTPQDIDENADVLFDSTALNDLTASRLVSSDQNKKLVSIAALSAWIAGTANQITVTDDGDGTITLSLPQDIDTSADVEFDSLLLSGVAPQLYLENPGDATGARNAEIRFQFSDGDGACIKSVRPSVGTKADAFINFFSGGNLASARLRIDKDGNVIIPNDSLKLLIGSGLDFSLYYDGTDAWIKTDEVAASDLLLQCGANKTLELQNTVYEDIQFPISDGKLPAANFPTFSTFTTNTKEYQFDVNALLYLKTKEYAHAFKNLSSWSFHLHATTDSANASGSSQYAKFTLYVAYADTGDTWTETSVTAELEIPDGTASLEAFFLTLGTVSPSKPIGTQIKLTIKRIAATGGTEYHDEIFLTQIGLHGKVNTMGSRQIGQK
jgi:hypothetical protein